MQEKAKPYVGITGFKTAQEIGATAEAFYDNGFFSSNYLAMFGILSSDKRLDNPFQEGTMSPAICNLSEALEAVPKWGLPTIHYHTKEKEKLNSHIRAILTVDGIYYYGLCKAVQLNVDWPPLDQINKILKEFTKLDLVLQLPRRATEGLSLKEIAKRSKEYDALVKYALIDSSGGKGVEFDLEYGIELMNALNEAMPNTRIGIAGGLDGGNVKSLVSEISKKYNEDFFIDAQGKLRTDNKEALDYEKARDYIKSSATALLRKKIAEKGIIEEEIS